MRRGYTLVESLVIAALFVLVAGILAGFLIASFRFYGRGVRHGHLQQSALVVLARVREEVRLSRGDLLVPQGAGVLAVASHRPLSCDPASGEVLWRRWLYFYYRPDTREVRLHESEFGPTARPAPPPALTQPYDRRDRLLARNVDTFQVTSESGLIRVVVEVRDGDLKTRLETRVAPLNSVAP
ncbi:MAG: type II secretion system protein [Candidatus Eremiobacterota bacterium]